MNGLKCRQENPHKEKEVKNFMLLNYGHKQLLGV